MVFELKSVFQNDGETKRVSYQLDLTRTEIDGAFPFSAPVEVSALAVNRASLVTLELDCKYDYFRCCDRCGEPVTRRVESVFEHRLAQNLSNDENDDYIETPDLTVELDEIVTSDILLSLPGKFLCSENCKGLCPKCGANLNNGECDCDKQSVDPRLAALKQLLN